MTHYDRDIPNNVADLTMEKDDTLTLTFSIPCFALSVPPDAFDPLLFGPHLSGTNINLTFTCKEDGADIDWMGIDMVMHTIKTSSGLDLIKLEKFLSKDPELGKLFCKCWPCVAELGNALIAPSVPLPKSVKQAIKMIVGIGDAIYAKVCK